MTVPVIHPRAKSGPVNRNLIGAAACARIAWISAPDAGASFGQYIFYALSCLGAALCGI